MYCKRFHPRIVKKYFFKGFQLVQKSYKGVWDAFKHQPPPPNFEHDLRLCPTY